MAKPVVDQVMLWQNINALPEVLQRHMGKLFVGKKRWAQAVLAAREARKAREKRLMSAGWSSWGS